MKTTGKNQSRSSNKTSVTVRLDTYDMKCLQLLALSNGYTLSKQLALLVTSATAQTRALIPEHEIDRALEEFTHREN